MLSGESTTMTVSNMLMLKIDVIVASTTRVKLAKSTALVKIFGNRKGLEKFQLARIKHKT